MNEMNEALRDNLTSIPLTSADDKKNITIGALIQGVFTLLSRIFGMVRDVMVTHIFGAGAMTDAFFVAATIPNVLRQFFGEGAFSVAFVPIYLSTKEKEGEQKAREFFRDAFGFLLIALLVVVVIGIIFSKTLVHLFAHGFADNNEQFLLTNYMTKWLFPYVLMVSLVALFGAYLACYQRFAAMAAAPVLLNIAMIMMMVFFSNDFFSPPVMVLVFSFLLGGILQMGLMITALKRTQLWATPTFSVTSDAMKRLIKLLGPALFGVFVYQLNIIVLRQLASFLGEGQITYYYNADRLTQFATGVFAISIATAALPELSKKAAHVGSDSFFRVLRFTLIVTSFIITPCAFGLVVFAYPVISVLFVHGNFTHNDAIITAQTLMAFSPSLIAFSFSRPLVQAFYAQGDTKTPVLVGIVTVLLNLTLGLLLLRFEIIGLSMTLSISSFVQFFLLLFLFKKKNEHPFRTELWTRFFAHAGISLLACAVGYLVSQLGDFEKGFTVKNAIVLCLLSSAAGGSYFLFAYYFKLTEARAFIDGIMARLFKQR